MKPRAQLFFALDALLGVVVIGAAALFGAAWAPKGSAGLAFAKVFLPLAATWLVFSYGAYRGLTSSHAALKVVFWANLAVIAFIFPVGTALAAWAVWLWRDQRDKAAASP